MAYVFEKAGSLPSTRRSREITKQHLSAEMKRARAGGLPFWPSPGEFIQWCRKGEYSAADHRPGSGIDNLCRHKQTLGYAADGRN